MKELQHNNITSTGNTKETIEKILLAIDKSGYREKIIRYGLTLAKALKANVTAVHVIDRVALGVAGDLLSYYRGGKVGEYQEVLKKQAQKLLSEVEILAKNESVEIDIEVIINAPTAAEGIIQFARNANMDLIIVGTQGMSGVEKFLLGSVANKVTSHAHCPVLVVR